MNRRNVAAVLLSLALTTHAMPARAGTITLTETVTATGTLGGVAFTNALITLVATGDTQNRTTTANGTIAAIPASSATLAVAGFAGTPTFTVASRLLAATGAPGVVGIGAVPSLDVLDVASASFNGADLLHSVSGTGTAMFNPGMAFATTGGNFVIASVSGLATATIVAPSMAPEPSSWVLMGLGLAGVAMRARLTRRAA